MDENQECKKCNPPFACLVSCPNNTSLDRMGQPFCLLLLDALADPDAELEIVLSSESPKAKDDTASS